MIPVDLHSWPEWILRALHLDPDRLPQDAEAWIRLQRFPESGLGLLAILAILAGLVVIGWIYRREGAVAAPRKIALACLRSAVLVAVALALFDPVLELSVERDQRATTLVLIDRSLSFGIRDSYRSDPDLRAAVAASTRVNAAELGSRSRSELALSLLNRDGAQFLEELARNNLLKIYTFSSGLKPIAAGGETSGGDSAGESGDAADSRGEAPADVAASPDTPQPAGAAQEPDGKTETIDVPELRPADIAPVGTATDLGGALRAAVEAQGSAPIAAVVVITDGRRTGGEDPLGVADFLAEREIPIHTIGIGDPTPTRNLRIVGVFAPERSFARDPVAVDVRVDHQGLAGESITVELVDTFGGQERPVGRSELVLGDEKEATARFELRLQEPGRHDLVARVPPREDESFRDDNERATLVTVLDEATEVLLVAGAPSNEYRIVKNLLRRDNRIELACWLMSADLEYPQEGNKVLERLPTTARELFTYDVVILLDPDPRSFPASYPDLLEKFVGRHRGGLLYVAGEKYSTPFFRNPRLGPLHDLLPIEPDMNRAEAGYARGRFYSRQWPLVPTLQAVSHPATRIATRPERNRERWAQLPGLYWSFAARKPKPTATVLLEHSDPSLVAANTPRPLLAYQFYEGGRVAYLGFDETWRWRSVHEEFYDQFWMQMVRALMEGRLLGDRRQLVLTDRDAYDLGDGMRLSAFVQDEEYRPSTAERVVATVTDPQGRTHEVELPRDPSQEGWFRGIYMPADAGVHEVSLPGGSTQSVQVEIPDLEYEDPTLDRATLVGISERTGGLAVLPEALDRHEEIPGAIPDRRQRIVLSDEPKPLWDNAIALGLVVALLTAEWIGRKLNRLP